MTDKPMTDKIVVLGGNELVTGFKLAGIENFVTYATPEEGEQKLAELLAKPDYGIVVCTERLLEGVDWRLKKKVESTAKPVVIAIPDRQGPVEQSESIAVLVKRALGFDLMKKK